ncbi:hypothetical protein LTR99_000588 [Exophiala xenobiotica]|uniref:Uncharacterized protein n=1 Tax=Vermiconidia calcicola TaxID=1690605 RepID=A0AAV9QJT1_9PEZI|nr:hypothetical protein H2202_003762 [Exophiala xenobiotica]KAK5543588.1 hypothetical protein LTR25_001202 [Vermiconidia calcicola]KAK5548251.1 hypothetical protein LTR23_001960 [Chaetothyriales sp. CCFEE 6169]KAK5197055.1 hypothetical protein LTR92_002993 [Exophiala xenobiotica]KAK5237962.1 hypothetical protein LTR47_001055 [Exophiala xenobiotica]
MAPYPTGTATAPTPPEWYPANEHRSNLVTAPGKRKADDELESQSNISSQFKKLRLNQNHAIPPQAFLQSTTPPSSTGVSFRPLIANTDARPAILATPPVEATHLHSHSSPTFLPQVQTQEQEDGNAVVTSGPLPTLQDSEFMTVDETPHRVIITNLAHEIAQIEADEAAASHTVFLPDIDKKVSAIPQRFLQNHPPQNPSPPLSLNTNTALVLYRDPTSITVPEEEDAVRKAIIAARTRAREKQAAEWREREREGQDQDIEFDDAMTDHSSYRDRDEDSDAMEIE